MTRNVKQKIEEKNKHTNSKQMINFISTWHKKQIKLWNEKKSK